MTLYERFFGAKPKATETVQAPPAEIWIHLESMEGLEAAANQSHKQPVVLFKHSTRCGTSSRIQRHIKENWDINPKDALLFHLDLIAHREVSNQIAEKFGIEHKSPQIIILRNGKAVYHTSHGRISVDGIRNAIQK